jgi:hypothetical protein
MAGNPGPLAVSTGRGARLVADDTGETIRRISYKGLSERAAAPDEKSRAAGR